MGRASLAKERRQQIVEAYYRSILKHGIEGSSIVKIAAEAGLAPSMITHYFRSKDEMAMEFTRHVLQKYENRYLAELEQIADPWERLETVIRIMFSDKFIDQEMLRVFHAIIYRSSRSPEVRETLKAMYEGYFADLKGILIQAAGPEYLSAEDGERLAVMLVAFQDGMHGHWLMNPAKADPSMPQELLLTILRRHLGGKRGELGREMGAG